MIFRKAENRDIRRIVEIYDRIHDMEEKGEITIGWERYIYPTEESARQALKEGDLFVQEADGRVTASARINQEQVHPVYENAKWLYEADDRDVCVLHALTVDPELSRKGYGKAFVEFYEEHARKMECRVLRIDTNERNERARAMYQRLGYREADILPCEFNGIPGVNLVCLEKKL